MGRRPVEPTKSGHARMRPRARIISLIGDELISDECVAVVELVKNAYDADATRVEVKFEGDDPSSPDTLVISDDGVGMTLDTVLNGWFEPATVEKKKASRTPGGRPYQGAKGIGRFAAARIAESLHMETRAKGAKGVTVDLNWGQFDDNSYLDQVEIEYKVGPLPHLKHGTTLKLIGIQNRKEWNDDDFKALHDRLSRLISPFDEVNDFSIELTIPYDPSLTGTVEPHRLTQEPKYRLVGRLDDKGCFTGSIYADGKLVKKHENVPLGAKKGQEVECGPFEVEFRAWDRDRQGLTPYMLKYDMGIREIRHILDAYSGVSIYRDGFRVHPYGEPGNDWLQLDNRSRQSPTTHLANNQIIGAIKISRDSNSDLVDRTTREGLVHNRAYEALTDWVVRILTLLQSQRYRLRPREETKPEETHTLFEVFDLSPVVHEADRQLGKHHPISQLVRKSDTEIREGVERLQEHYSRLLMTAGIGQMVDLVIHEIGAPIGRANRELAHLEKQLGRWVKHESLEEARQLTGNIKVWIEQVVALRNRLDPKAAGKRGRATAFKVEDEIQGNLMLFENLLAKQKIKPTLSCAPADPVVVHMVRPALGQILANLVDNSIYWLTRHHGDGNGGRIDIHLSRAKHGFIIRFCDDGPGVGEGDRDRIFDPYFSTKPNGMGLGLYVARQVIDRYGKLVYRDDCNLGGACFEAIFERNVGL